MRLKKISFRIDDSDRGRRLDHVLAERLPALTRQNLSRGQVRKLIVAGAVYLNRSRTRIASKEVRVGTQVDVHIDWEKISAHRDGGKDIPFEMTQSRVLFEDDYLIAVDKPAGLPTQPTVDEARDNLFASVRRFLASRASLPPQSVYLALHHRLDRDTSGVVLMSKATAANVCLAEAFSTHQMKKVYHALSTPTAAFRGPPRSGSWSVRNYLGRASGTGGSRKKNKYGSVKSGGDAAHTDFQILGGFKEGLWIEARPHTGRTHQIRVHLSEFGLPILGDLTYGGAKLVGSFEIPRMMLHAVSLTFAHPIHHNEIAIHSGVPGDFSKCLEALKRGRSDS